MQNNYVEHLNLLQVVASTPHLSIAAHNLKARGGAHMHGVAAVIYIFQYA